MLLKSVHIHHNQFSLHAGFTYKPALSYQKQSDSFMPEAVRHRLQKIFHSNNNNIAYLNQIHSGLVHFVNQAGLQGDGDALVTQTPDLILTVKTADCIPLLVWDPEAEIIAAIHAGWKGLKNNIIENTLNVILKYSGSLKNSTFLLGPHLKSCHFEVTEEFLNHFPARFFLKKQKYYFDPTGYTYFILEEKFGIRKDQIMDFSTCTYCDPLCMSYRRDGKTEERHIGYIFFNKKGGHHES